jgi:uncharacterized membrane protein
MNTNKFIVGGIIGGVAYFLLGWLVWGMLLMDFMTQNAGSAAGVMKTQEEMVWWALIVGNIFSGLTLSYVLSRAGVKTAGAGAAAGAAFGLLVSAGFDFTMFGTANIMSMKGILVDIAASTVVTAVVGGVIGWYFGMGQKSA